MQPFLRHVWASAPRKAYGKGRQHMDEMASTRAAPHTRVWAVVALRILGAACESAFHPDAILPRLKRLQRLSPRASAVAQSARVKRESMLRLAGSPARRDGLRSSLLGSSCRVGRCVIAVCTNPFLRLLSVEKLHAVTSRTFFTTVQNTWSGDEWLCLRH